MRWILMICFAGTAVIALVVLYRIDAARSEWIRSNPADRNIASTDISTAVSLQFRLTQALSDGSPEDADQIRAEASSLASKLREFASPSLVDIANNIENEATALAENAARTQQYRVDLRTMLQQAASTYTQIRDNIASEQIASFEALTRLVAQIFEQTMRDEAEQLRLTNALNDALRTIVSGVVRDQMQPVPESLFGPASQHPLTVARIRQLELTVSTLMDRAASQRSRLTGSSLEFRNRLNGDLEQGFDRLESLIALRTESEKTLGRLASIQTVAPDRVPEEGLRNLLSEHSEFQKLAASTPVGASPEGTAFDISSVGNAATTALSAALEHRLALARTGTDLSASVALLNRLNEQLLQALQGEQFAIVTGFSATYRSTAEALSLIEGLMLVTFGLSFAALSLTAVGALRSRKAALASAPTESAPPAEHPVEQTPGKQIDLAATTVSEPKKRFADVPETLPLEIDAIQDRLAGLRQMIEQRSANPASSSLDLDALKQLTDETESNLAKTIDGSSQTSAALDKISKLCQGMASLSDKTRLLALNASIEASHAGPHGAGFGVVASELQKLAERSRDTSAQIEQASVTARDSNTEVTQSTCKVKSSIGDAKLALADLDSQTVAVPDPIEGLEIVVDEISDKLTLLQSGGLPSFDRSDKVKR